MLTSSVKSELCTVNNLIAKDRGLYTIIYKTIMSPTFDINNFGTRC